MSSWAESIQHHPVFGEVEAFEASLSVIQEGCLTDQLLADNWNRAHAVVGRIRRVLDQADPFLIIPASLGAIASSLQQARSEINIFSTNGGVGNWANIQSHMDHCLSHVAPVPLQSVDGLEDIKRAFFSYRELISKLVEEMTGDAQDVSKAQSELQTKISDATTEITSQKQRLDNAIATFQQQFSDAQQARQTEHSASEQARLTAAMKAEEDRQRTFDNSEENRDVNWGLFQEGANEAHKNLVLDLEQQSNGVVAALKERKGHVEKLVGIISNTGMAYGFQKSANEERAEATTWKRAAAGSLVVWIIIGVVFFTLTYDKDLTWATVARQLLLSTPFVLLSGFAALQVSRHQKNERQMRQAELEIASIDPFLATLSDEDRNEVKREFATRYFGQRESEKKQEESPASLVDLAGELVKVVQELTKK